MKDLISKIKPVTHIVGTTIVDRAGFESVSLVCTVEDGTVITVTEGDESDLSDGATAGADFVLGKTTYATADGTAGKVGYVGDKRYVKFAYSVAIPAAPHAFAILGDAHQNPPA